MSTNDKPRLTGLKAVYSQDEDTAGRPGNVDQYIEIEAVDGGAGFYWRIKTTRWAIDGPEDLTTLLEDFISRVEGKKK